MEEKIAWYIEPGKFELSFTPNVNAYVYGCQSHPDAEVTYWVEAPDTDTAIRVLRDEMDVETVYL